jgi:hypothetical protein
MKLHAPFVVIRQYLLREPDFALLAHLLSQPDIGLFDIILR